MAKIRELGEMRSQGLLTDEEFAAEKASIPACSGRGSLQHRGPTISRPSAT
jgi:hypothetical protein